MKTIKQWFETFEDAEIRKRALENTLKKNKEKEAKSIENALFGAFIWEETKEGGEFWISIYSKRNPASVKFDEVKHLIKND